MAPQEPEVVYGADVAERVDKALDAHRFFIRRARDRAQQMMFFLELCRPAKKEGVNEVIRSYREFARKKIGDLEKEVTGADELAATIDVLLADLSQAANLDSVLSLTELREAGKVETWREQVVKEREKLDFNNSLDHRLVNRDLLYLAHCREELELWEQVRRVSERLPARAGDEDWRSARDTVKGFLVAEGITSPVHVLARKRYERPRWLWSPVQRLRTLPMWAAKHFALLLTLAVGLFVVFKVEAVSSLIFNMGALALIPFALGLLPFLLTDGWRLLRYGRNEQIPAWDAGGSAHRSRFARAPRRFFQRWPDSSQTRDTAPSATAPAVPDREASSEVSGGLKARPQDILKVLVRGRIFRLYYLVLWIGGAIALSAGVSAGKWDSTYLTVFGVVAVLYFLVLAARLIDFWDFFESKAIRRYWLFFAAIGAGALLLGWGYAFFVVAFLVWTIWFFLSYRRRRDRPLRRTLAIGFAVLVLMTSLLWVTSERGVWREPGVAQDWRSNLTWPMPGDEPVVVMAASGGGSRAALYTALTLEMLDGLEVACGGESRRCPLSEALQMISSVSGGSLANAGYVARRMSKLNGRPIAEALTQAVSGDFMLPVLHGALNPFLSRGDSIEKTWQGLGKLVRGCTRTIEEPRVESGFARQDSQGMALGDICLSDLAAAWGREVEKGADARVPFPMPLFNTSTLDGHDLVITPLPKEQYTSSDFAAQSRNPDKNLYARPDATWVFYRDGIYALEDLLGESFDPLLSTSVRASANFPFGFPLVAVQARRPLFLQPDWQSRCTGPEWKECEERRVHLTDGGALSNSGMWPLFRLLVNKKRELRKRGVLLILIDASRMAEYGAPEKTYLRF